MLNVEVLSRGNIVPMRSKLYSLTPEFLYTHLVESLTSYIQRLAAAHCVTVTVFVQTFIVPALNKGYLSKDAERGCSRFFERAVGLNGVKRLGKECIEVLEELTLTCNLDYLTLQQWSNVLVPTNLCRSDKVWCPLCLNEWRSKKIVLYEPLLWSISEVTTCPVHNVSLVKRCPHCNKEMRIISGNSVVGYCTHCRGFLGEAISMPLTCTQEKERWSTSEIVVLIDKMFATSKQNIRRENIKLSFENLLNQLSNNNIQGLGSIINVHKSTLWQYCNGKYIPSLGTIVDICYSGNIQLFDFYMASPINYKNNDLRDHRKTKLKRNPKTYDCIEAVLNQYSISEIPLSLNAIVKELEVSSKTLKKHFPELMCNLKMNYEDYRSRKGKERIANLCLEVIEATTWLYNEGLTLSARAVERKMGRSGVLLRKEIRSCWKQIKKQLMKELINAVD